MGRFGAFALILVASGCAAVTGLGDYDVEDAPTASALDGGSVSTGADASPSNDGSSPAPDGARPETGTADVTIPTVDAGVDAASLTTCARTTCPTGSPRCIAEPCDTNKVWEQAGEDGDNNIHRTGGRCIVEEEQSYLLASIATTTSPFVFELGFTMMKVGGAQTATIAEIGTTEKTIFELRIAAGKIRLCSAEGQCNAEVAVMNTGDFDVDVVGYYSGGRFRGFLSAGTNVCPNGAGLEVQSAGKEELTARVGCVGNDNCKLEVDDLTFSVTLP